MQQLLPCPQVGHTSFENNLKQIRLGDTETPSQISKFIRPATCTQDDSLGITYAAGELQKKDLSMVPLLFAYPRFVLDTFRAHSDLFNVSQCRVYQFQTIPKSGNPFVFGLFITDSQHNLIDFCVDSRHPLKRRHVLTRLMRVFYTPESIKTKLNH